MLNNRLVQKQKEIQQFTYLQWLSHWKRDFSFFLAEWLAVCTAMRKFIFIVFYFSKFLLTYTRSRDYGPVNKSEVLIPSFLPFGFNWIYQVQTGASLPLPLFLPSSTTTKIFETGVFLTIQTTWPNHPSLIDIIIYLVRLIVPSYAALAVAFVTIDDHKSYVKPFLENSQGHLFRCSHHIAGREWCAACRVWSACVQRGLSF